MIDTANKNMITVDGMAAVYSTLCYFSIFQHPLTRTEIHEYLHYQISGELNIDLLLDELIASQCIESNSEYYFLKGNKDQVARRIKGENAAMQLMPKANKFSKLISAFPFVRGVFVSGSMSKGYMDANSDIDYFIVTKPGRLWICRTLLIVYKKIFLLNSHRFFCLNYFVDENNLVITDRNIFTATELVFLMPMYGHEIYQKLVNQNKWVIDFYPYKLLPTPFKTESKMSLLKKMVEWLLCFPPLKYLESFFLNLTIKYWKLKFRNSKLSFHAELRSYAGVSKHHPNGYENRIVVQYNKLVSDFEKVKTKTGMLM